MGSTGSSTQTHILEAAWRLFEERQRADVRLEEVAHAAGVSRQAIYLHFKGRTELLEAVIAHVQATLGGQARLAEVDAAPSGVEALHALVVFSACYTPKMYPFAVALDRARAHDEDAERAWVGRMQSRLQRAERIAARLAADGHLEVEVQEAADVIWTLTSLSTWEHLVRDRQWSAGRFVEWVVRALTDALLNPEGAQIMAHLPATGIEDA